MGVVELNVPSKLANEKLIFGNRICFTRYFVTGVKKGISAKATKLELLVSSNGAPHTKFRTARIISPFVRPTCSDAISRVRMILAF